MYFYQAARKSENMVWLSEDEPRPGICRPSFRSKKRMLLWFLNVVAINVYLKLSLHENIFHWDLFNSKFVVFSHKHCFIKSEYHLVQEANNVFRRHKCKISG
jgi:hypothetical protein